MLAIAVLCLSFAAKAETKLYFNDFEIEPNTTTAKEIPLYMDYDNPDVGGFQCDIHLPSGLNFDTYTSGKLKITVYSERDYDQDEDGFKFTIWSNVVDDVVKVMISNIEGGDGYPVKGNSGDRMLKCMFVTNANFEGGMIEIKNTRVTDTKGSANSIIGLDTTARVTVPNTTGIEEVNVEDTEAEFYNLQGVKVDNLKQGVYIKKQGNKAIKVVVK